MSSWSACWSASSYRSARGGDTLRCEVCGLEPGQTTFEDVGCSASCEKEKQSLRLRVATLTERNSILEVYLQRYSNQEVDDFLKARAEALEILARWKEFHGHRPDVFGTYMLVVRRELARLEDLGRTKKRISGRWAWEELKKNTLFAGTPLDNDFEPIYSRYAKQTFPELEGIVRTQKSSRFEGFDLLAFERGEPL